MPTIGARWRPRCTPPGRCAGPRRPCAPPGRGRPGCGPSAAGEGGGVARRHEQPGLAVARRSRACRRPRSPPPGAPQFIASHTTVGSPSLSEGSTKRSPAAIHQPTSSCGDLAHEADAVADAQLGRARARSSGRSSPMPGGHAAGAPRRGARPGGPSPRSACRRPCGAPACPRRSRSGRRRAGPGGPAPRRAGAATKTRVSAPLGTIGIGRRGVARASAASRDRPAHRADPGRCPRSPRPPARGCAVPGPARPARRRGGRWPRRARRARRPSGPRPSRRAPPCGRGSRRTASARGCGAAGRQIGQSIASVLRWPRRRARQRELARVEDRDAVDRRRRPAPRGSAVQRESSGRRPALRRDHPHVVAELDQGADLLVDEDPARSG